MGKRLIPSSSAHSVPSSTTLALLAAGRDSAVVDVGFLLCCVPGSEEAAACATQGEGLSLIDDIGRTLPVQEW